MSDCAFFLCGVTVVSQPPSDPEEDWLCDYRISEQSRLSTLLTLISSVYGDGTGVFVTGVGSDDGLTIWKAPKDPLLRWDSMSESEGPAGDTSYATECY